MNIKELDNAVKATELAIDYLRKTFGEFCSERNIVVKELTGIDLNSTPIGMILKYSKVLIKANTDPTTMPTIRKYGEQG
jgi:hypothetical protein